MKENYSPVYGVRPWLVCEDLPEVAALFRTEGTPFEVSRRTIIDLGQDASVYWIEDGMIGTYPAADGSWSYIAGLFGPNTVLGSVRALGHPGKKMALIASAFCDVRGYRLPTAQYRAWVAADPIRNREMLENCIGKTECQLEGSFVSGTCLVPERLLQAFRVLFAAARIPDDAEFAELPWNFSVTDLSQLVHAERGMVSRAISAWVRLGLCEKRGRHLYISRQLFAPG